ncbi:MAG: acyltransferase [Isosphaeraceae bacterium]|nr:acyltransferase [Isosphaeraceae bacterium]
MGHSERVEAIDVLRGVAALAVVLYHYVGFIPFRGIPVGPIGSVVVTVTRYGHLGVPIFFVLSGYVIAMTASRYTFTPSAGARFVLRRLVRLAPPYWVVVGLITAAVMAGQAAGYFKHSTVTFGQVAAHLVYAQNLLGLSPLDVAYWTLCLEIQFYLVFAASAVAVHRCSPGLRSGWFATLTVGSVLIDILDVVPKVWFPRLWYQFGVGILAYDAGRERPARLALRLLLPLLVGLGVYGSRAADLTVALVVGFLLSHSRPSRRSIAYPGILLGLGRISYSLYLVHGFVGIGLSVGFRSSAIQSETAAWVAIAAGTMGALTFAAAFHHLCERRGVEWSRLVRVGPAQVLASGLAREAATSGRPSSVTGSFANLCHPARPR